MSNENMNNDTVNNSQTEDDTVNEESFASLFEKNGQLPERLIPGQKVTTKVVSISGDLVFVNLGMKSEGAINLDEFKGEDGSIQVQEGDEIEAFFVTVTDGMMIMTTLLHGYSVASINALSEAHETGTPVDGSVERSIKGGYEVLVGGVRCFCPSSQIDLKGGKESDIYVGKSFPFRVVEFGEEGRNIIISRRVLLEEERAAKIEQLKSSLTMGMEVTAHVTSIQKFGVFVHLDGIDALIPVSEMSWGRVDHPEEIVSVGDEISAKVIGINWDHERISLSMKALLPDPWSHAAKKYPEGSKIQGTIIRLVPFGAFVAIEPGLDGLMHISNLGTGRRIKHPKEVVQVGQAIESYVLSVDPENRKLSLSMQPKREIKKIDYPKIGTFVEGTVENVMPYGIFLKFTEDLTGLIPNSEMDTPRGSDHSRMFPKGTMLQAIVVDVDEEKGKVRLSRRAIEEKESEKEFERYKETVKQEDKPSDGIGSFGELLKAKMEEKNIQNQ